MSCLPVTELEGYGAYKQFGYALASLDYDKVSFGTTRIWYFFWETFLHLFFPQFCIGWDFRPFRLGAILK